MFCVKLIWHMRHLLKTTPVDLPLSGLSLASLSHTEQLEGSLSGRLSRRVDRCRRVRPDILCAALGDLQAERAVIVVVLTNPLAVRVEGDAVPGPGDGGLGQATDATLQPARTAGHRLHRLQSLLHRGRLHGRRVLRGRLVRRGGLLHRGWLSCRGGRGGGRSGSLLRWWWGRLLGGRCLLSRRCSGKIGVKR